MRRDPRATEWTVQGPFHGVHEDCPNGANICLDGSDKPGGDATPALVTGRVLDCVTGAPIPGAKVDVWLTAVDDQYAVQRRAGGRKASAGARESARVSIFDRRSARALRIGRKCPAGRPQRRAWHFLCEFPLVLTKSAARRAIYADLLLKEFLLRCPSC